MDPIDPGTERLPWRLRAVALVFVSLGTAGTASMVSRWMRGEMWIDLGPLVIWLGASLLKRSDGARFWGLIVSWFWVAVIALLLLLHLATGRSPELHVPGKFTLTVPLWAAALFIAFLLGLSVWLIAMLRRLKREGLFRSPVPLGTRLDRRSRRHVLATIAAWAVLALAGEVWAHSLPDAKDEGLSIGKSDGQSWLVCHGTRFGKLAYVVFKHGLDPQTFPIEQEGIRPRKAYLIKPDGTRLLLPGGRQLYEIADGVLRTSDRRVTLDEFKAFRRSSPDEYTIDALLSFIDSGAGGD